MIRKDLGEKIFASSQHQQEREYWLNKLSGELIKTTLPSDNLPHTEGTTEKQMHTLNFLFPPELYNRLLDIINNSDSRLHMVLATGLTLFLYKYTGNLDITIGTPIDKQEIEGEFINTILPIRTLIDEQINIKELLKQMKQTIIEASENQNYPIETIPHELGITSTDSSSDFPLFDIALVLQNIQDQRYIEHIQFNILFSFLRTPLSLEGCITYNAAMYEASTIQRVVTHFLHLMHQAFFHVDTKLMAVPVQTDAEDKQMLFDFNNTLSDYPRARMIHQLFEEQVLRNPHHIAVQNPHEKLTYLELNQKANQLAHLLREKGITNNTITAIMLESSIEVPLAILAVLKAGGAYLPMGFEYPEERIDYLLKNSQAKVLLTRQNIIEGKHIACPTLFVDDPANYTASTENLEPVNTPESLVYVIYTSGTTGQPKGVMIEHRGLVNYIWWAANTYVKNEKVDFPLYTSISFDLTVTSIFTPLVTGNTIKVYGGVDKKLYIEDVIDENQVGVVKLTPSHLKLIRSKTIKNSSIKRLIVGGEELETTLAREIYQLFGGNIEIYNEYGPTETVVGSMIYLFSPQTDTRHSVPIGVPIANTQVYLLNAHLQPIPYGVTGELYISGDGLARGYMENPALSAEKFVPNPFIPGTRMYKTGDLAIRLPNGNIEYKGRIDHQIKIRGHRVETGEIEAKIVAFQKMARAGREQKENIVEKLDLRSLQHCKTCLIPINYPGGIHFDEEGVCDICREFETYQDKARAYFKTNEDFKKIVELAQKTKNSKYDCLLLYSGGKDSSYTLIRLVEMGLKVLAFTFDNGYISDKAFENIARTTKLFNVDHVQLKSDAMKEIFVESLWSDYNVCNGCFKAVNTLGTKIAEEHNINLVISGLTRGQIFDIKLHGLFKLGVFDEETIEERLRLFRKSYHSMTNRTSRLIGVEIADQTLEKTYFVDFFRYDQTPTHEIYEFLKKRDNGWVRPTDTGASSSNCIINDVGIYVHLKDKGCHFYAPQLSWDCRLGTITREEGLEEMWGYKVNYPQTHHVLNEIGYYNAFTGAVVTEIKDERGEKALCAYILADNELEVSELRTYLAKELPDYMIPTYFTRIDRIPLTPSGKINRNALPAPKLSFKEDYVAPRNGIEERLVDVWSELLGLKKEKIGIDVNFFEVGGHSLRATFLAASINKEFNVKVPLVKIFEKPTIRDMSEFIAEAVQENFVAIPVAPEKEYYVLSSAQKRLYILQHLDFTSTAYNVNIIVQLNGELQPAKLTAAFQGLINRHGNLRTSFEMIDNTPMQHIHPATDIKFQVQYSDLSATVTPNEIISSFIRPFDLSQAPLLRVEVVKISAHQQLLLVDLHHIITDGISQGLLIKDFKALYSGVELPPLKLQYKDYSEWQQSPAIKNEIKKQEEFWLRQFEGEIPVLDIPTDFPRPLVQSFEGTTAEFQLSIEQTTALNSLAQSEGATMFMVLLAAYNVLIAKLSQQQEIIVGTPIAGRRYPGLEDIIGVFINTLALKNYPLEETSFRQFVKHVKQNTLTAFENQDYCFEDLVEKVAVERNVGRNPLFDTTFIFQNMFNPTEVAAESKVAGLNFSPYPHQNRMSKFDLSLISAELQGILYFTFEYCTKIFRPETITRFIEYFKKVIGSILEDPEQKIMAIEITSPQEKEQLLYQFNDTQAEYPVEKTLVHLFAEQVLKTPHHIALIGQSLVVPGHHEVQVSYQQLEQKASLLAQYLVAQSIQPDSIVALCMERSVEMITAMLGILKAGGAYLPIDPSYPQDRIDFIIKDSAAAIVLTAEHINPPALTPTISLDAIPLAPQNLAYVIYTSGTTGKPKGVLIPHQNVVRLMKNSCFPFAFSNADVWTLFHSTSFDFSVWEMYGALLYGGKVVIIQSDSARDTVLFLDILKRQQVTVLNQTPSAFYLLSDEELKTDSRWLSIRYIIFGAEALKPALLKNWFARYPQTHLINMYGITETTVHVTVKEIGPAEIATGISNIGVPIPTLRTYILDKHMHLAPLGVAGELYVAGDGVARGYLNRPALTAEKFLSLSLASLAQDTAAAAETTLFYRSGDLARWLPDGTMEYLGRIDHQVKIRGFRIEPGEIEKCLTQVAPIKEAMVIEREDREQGKYLCAYFIAQTEIAITSLRTSLLNVLPEYMIPAFFVQLEKFPLTPNGKVDRKALPVPQKAAGDINVFIAPRNPVEEQMADIWSTVLGIDKKAISIDANFFRLGGHSLLATIMSAQLHKQFLVRFSLAEVFRNPTIRGLAEYLQTAIKEQYQAITPLPAAEYYDVSHAQRRMWVFEYFDKASTAYIMRNWYPFDHVNIPVFEKAVETVVQRHEILRTTFPAVEGQPKQKVHELKASGFHVEHIDLRLASNPQAAAEQIFENEGLTPFDLANGPLLRVKLLQLSAHQFLFVYAMHHIISDGWSMQILINETIALYNAFSRGEANPLPPLRIQYKDFAAWHNQMLTDQALQFHQDYWLERFKGDIPVLQLKTDFPRPTIKTYSGKSIFFELDAELTQRMRTMGEQKNVSLLMILSAAVVLLLQRYSQQDDLIVGIPVSGREHAELEHQVGCYLNMMPLRLHLNPGQFVAAYLESVKTALIELFDHQVYPFDLLVEKLQLQRDQSRSPLFDVVIQLLNFEGIGTRNKATVQNQLPVDQYVAVDNITSKFDLVFNFSEVGPQLRAEINFNTSLFEQGSILLMAEKLKAVFREIVQVPQVPLNQLNLEIAAEKKLKDQITSDAFAFEEA